MTAVGRALMAKPKMILLDEPSMGLAPQIVSEIFEIVENLNKKEALLKEMQMLLDEDLETHNAWQNALKKFNALREEFKTIGYVPAKESKASWKTFRDVGTEFMRKKNVFYKEQKKAFNDNIDSKNKLIERSKEVLELNNPRAIAVTLELGW